MSSPIKTMMKFYSSLKCPPKQYTIPSYSWTGFRTISWKNRSSSGRCFLPAALPWSKGFISSTPVRPQSNPVIRLASKQDFAMSKVQPSSSFKVVSQRLWIIYNLTVVNNRKDSENREVVSSHFQARITNAVVRSPMLQSLLNGPLHKIFYHFSWNSHQQFLSCYGGSVVKKKKKKKSACQCRRCKFSP